MDKGNYSISFTDTALADITAKLLFITAESDRIPFDGAIHEYSWSKEAGLVDSDFVKSATVNGFRDVGIHPNILNHVDTVIMDADGNDTTACYRIIYIPGEIVITEARLNLWQDFANAPCSSAYAEAEVLRYNRLTAMHAADEAMVRLSARSTARATEQIHVELGSMMMTHQTDSLTAGAAVTVSEAIPSAISVPAKPLVHFDEPAEVMTEPGEINFSMDGNVFGTPAASSAAETGASLVPVGVEGQPNDAQQFTVTAEPGGHLNVAGRLQPVKVAGGVFDRNADGEAFLARFGLDGIVGEVNNLFRKSKMFKDDFELLLDELMA